MQNSLCVQVLHSIFAALLHGTRAAAVGQTLWRGTRNGIRPTQLSQRAPPIFRGRPLRWASAHILVLVVFDVKRFAVCYRTPVYLSCLSVTLVYCGQTVGWIRMPLGTDVGLGPGHIVLDGDPPPAERGTACSAPLFGPCLLWPNGRPSQQLLSCC